MGGGWYKYIGTVVGIDGCVYGIPYSKRIVKYDPINDTTSFVGEEADKHFVCTGNGAIARDGCIYALTLDCRVLKINTTNNSYGFVRNYASTESHYNNHEDGWQDAILGIDGCIYWAPFIAISTLKYDPHTDQISLVGCDFGTQRQKYASGALATDGVIYCIPAGANRVLTIDPWDEFSETTNANMEAHPETFGFLFQKITNLGESSALHESQTNFDHAIVKFGQKQVHEALEKSMKSVNVYCKEANLFPFMIVALYKETSAALSAINHLLRRDMTWMSHCTSSLEGKIPTDKKRKHCVF